MIPEVSILVSVYNSSNYIEKCAHSIFLQTFENLEVVFVNDCSTDDCMEKLQKVIEQYPNRKPFVKIINQERNRGTGFANITLINNASGKYFQFVDNDDYIEPEMTETLYKKAVSENADMVVSDFWCEYSKFKEYGEVCISPDNSVNLKNILTRKIIPCLWKNLMKRELFFGKEPVFIEGLDIPNDLYASIWLFFRAKKVVKIDKAFYHFIRTDKAASNWASEKYFSNIALWAKLAEDFISEHKIDINTEDFEFAKVDRKFFLIMNTNSYKLRKEYAWLFRDIEMKYINRFRFGEKIVLFFTHYGFHLLAHFIYLLIVLKNRNHKK